MAVFGARACLDLTPATRKTNRTCSAGQRGAGGPDVSRRKSLGLLRPNSPQPTWNTSA